MLQEKVTTSVLIKQWEATKLIEQALRQRMTGSIVLHVKEGRIMEVQKTEVTKV